MWLYRFIFFVIVMSVFIYVKNIYQFDVQDAVVYAVSIFIVAYVVEILFKLLKRKELLQP